MLPRYRRVIRNMPEIENYAVTRNALDAIPYGDLIRDPIHLPRRERHIGALGLRSVVLKYRRVHGGLRIDTEPEPQD